MTILTVDRKEFEKRVGKVTKELEDRISMFGTPVEKVTDSEVSVEVFPNRPDLLSAGNFARAIGQFIGKRGIVKFKVNKPEKDFVVTIEKSVKSVRPHTVCAIIKGIRFDDGKIKEIVDIQERSRKDGVYFTQCYGRLSWFRHGNGWIQGAISL